MLNTANRWQIEAVKIRRKVEALMASCRNGDRVIQQELKNVGITTQKMMALKFLKVEISKKNRIYYLNVPPSYKKVIGDYCLRKYRA